MELINVSNCCRSSKNLDSGSASHLRLRGEEGAGDSVHVLRVDLDADVVEAHLVEVERTPSGADVALTGIRGEGDRVLQVTARQVVTDSTVHIMLSGEERC